MAATPSVEVRQLIDGRIAEAREEARRLEAARFALTGKRPAGRPRKPAATSDRFPELSASIRTRIEAKP